MALVYSETEEKRPGGMRIDMSKINPNSPYRKHLENWYYLKFMLKNGTTFEKIQAGKELTICERKLAFWYKHPMFSVEQAGRDAKHCKETWSTDEAPKVK